MHGLLGAERRRVVDDLVAAFDEVTATAKPRWWSLEAPPGWGKTRLVQELFARLAARQPDPAYWPTDLSPSRPTEAAVPEAVRKRVTPGVDGIDPAATPEYFWWGLSCLSRPGSGFEALAQDLGQFTVHRDGLERRWRELAGLRDRAAHQWQLRRGELGQTTADEGVSFAAGAANLAVPGLGLLMLLGRWGVEQAQELRARPEDRVLPSAHSIADEVGPELERLGNGGVTLVIAIEDVHAADETLVDLLSRLMAAEASRVLLVTTSWPGLVDDGDRPVARLAGRHERRRVCAGVDVGSLDVADRAALARGTLPALDEAGALLIARKFSNPLAVQTACRLGAVRRAATRGTVAADVVAQLPADVSGLYEELWDELPPGVREALLLAALSAPASVGDALSFGDERWDPALVALALARAPQLLHDARRLLPDLDGAVTAYHWVKTVELLLQQFDDPAYRVVALDEAAVEYGAADRSVLHRSLATALCSLAGELEPARRMHADRLWLALVCAGARPQDDPDARSAALRVCERLAVSPAVAELEQVLAVTDSIDLRDRADPDVLHLLALRAGALRAVGRVGEALSLLGDLTTDVDRVAGADSAQALRVRDELAVCLDKAGRSAAAVDLLQSVLSVQRRVLADAAVDTLATRAHLATALGGAGRALDAAEAYTRLIPDLVRAFGTDQPVTFRARSNRAWWLGEAGRIHEAVLAYEDLLPRVERSLGPDAPDTLTTRANLANWLGESGRVPEAIELLTRLVADRARVLGADAPDTLRARGNRAWWLGASGRTAEALADLTAVFADRVRVLGADAPDTLRTRRHIGHFEAESGRVEAAVARLRDLLTDQRRVLGPSHPDVASTESELRRIAGTARASPELS